MKGNSLTQANFPPMIKKLPKKRKFQTYHESWQLAGNEESCVGEVSYSEAT
jgi:hypothetical protein